MSLERAKMKEKPRPIDPIGWVYPTRWLARSGLLSDLDVLIVAGDEFKNTRKEGVRLRGALKEIRSRDQNCKPTETHTQLPFRRLLV
jgi:hypothetical protein